MQPVVLAEPYVPIAPRRGTGWQSLLQHVLPWFLRRSYGIKHWEINGVERLEASLRAGHGILLLPNHCRDEDGLVLGLLARQVQVWFFYMASWHVLKMDALKGFFMPRLGCFSVYREGTDRASVKTAVDLLTTTSRPLVVFAEGYLSRTNDRLNSLMEGTAFLARAAAKKRAQHNPPSQVVIHPVGLRYRFLGQIETAVAQVVDELETRLGWPTSRSLPPRERLVRMGEALLAKKEIEYLGHAQTGPLPERQLRLIHAVIAPIEEEWLGGKRENETVQARVRSLRAVIVPGLAKGDLGEAERKRRWRQLAGIYLAQQLDNYPPDYLAGNPPDERLLETAERFEEDVTDRVSPHGPLAVTITVGEAIPVPPDQGRAAEGLLLREIERQLREMLGIKPAAENVQAPS
jgi:1-acyl-sn-glycerol-3-phosphate acyltransferase